MAAPEKKMFSFVLFFSKLDTFAWRMIFNVILSTVVQFNNVITVIVKTIMCQFLDIYCYKFVFLLHWEILWNMRNMLRHKSCKKHSLVMCYCNNNKIKRKQIVSIVYSYQKMQLNSAFWTQLSYIHQFIGNSTTELSLAFIQKICNSPSIFSKLVQF